MGLDFTSTTLIVPTVAVGNVPQLATDLLIHSYPFEKVRVLNGRYLYPFAAPTDTVETPSTPGTPSYALELYHCASLKLAILQQRAPVLSGHLGSFVREVILPLARDFARVVVIDSADAGILPRESLGDDYGVSLPATFEVYHATLNLTASLEGMQLDTAAASPLPHSSLYTQFLMRALAELLSSVAFTAVVTYVYEGDNVRDAEALATKVLEVVDVAPPKWRKPLSWAGVYGQRAVPQSMEEGIFG